MKVPPNGMPAKLGVALMFVVSPVPNCSTSMLFRPRAASVAFKVAVSLLPRSCKSTLALFSKDRMSPPPPGPARPLGVFRTLHWRRSGQWPGPSFALAANPRSDTSSDTLGNGTAEPEGRTGQRQQAV